MAINPSDFEYCWPQEPLVTELSALLGASDIGVRADQLFAEAFGSRALRVLGESQNEDDVRKLVSEVLDAFHLLPMTTSAGPYFAERMDRRLSPPTDAWTLSIHLHDYVEQLRQLGYFEESVPGSWKQGIEGGVEIDAALQKRLGVSRIWTSFTKSWDDAWGEDLVFSVIEVLHDLVARPRLILVNGADRRFGEFSSETGRTLFRAWINDELSGSSLDYRIAEVGEDVGRIINIGSPYDSEYLDSAIASTHQGAEEDVGHAIALFRKRDATREAKRSAIVALARILESRRSVLKVHLLTKDEADLFQIANKFDIRHGDESQRADYDEVFLDWMFRWYLATIVLSDHLIGGQANSKF